jgi:glycosyltransferase involved in cell wall biosynthesis
MKVIMIGSHLRVTGGITRVVKNYIQAGLNKKTELEYFPTYYGGNHFINILYFIAQYFKLYLQLNILNRKYDVAHIHMSYKGSFLRKKFIINLLHKKGITIIIHAHGGYFKQFYNESSDKNKQKISVTLNKASVILALGKEWTCFYESVCNTSVVCLNNAVFPKDLNNNHDEKIYITTMGLLSHKKGTYDLIDVVSKLKGKIDKRYKFVLAGNGEIEKVKHKINSLNLNDLFVIPGWISDENKIDEIYRKSLIYVLPSYYEGMPMSILEAMSYELPVISTNVGSIPTVINENNGFIIEPGNQTVLEEKILELLNNQSIAREFGVNNAKKINENYNIHKSVERILNIYNAK